MSPPGSQRVHFVLPRTRLGHRRADDRIQPRQYSELIGIPSFRVHSRLEIRVEALRAFERMLRREHHVRMPRRQFEAGFGRAGLHEQRPSLRAARHVQRPGDVEVPAVMIDAPDLRGIGEHAARRIGDERALAPAFPQLDRHVDELVRAGVALGRARQRHRAEIRGRGRIVGGDRVPARPAAAHLIERQEAAREGKRIAERRGRRADQPDAFGDERQRRRDDERIEHLRRPMSVAVQRKRIGEEERVELALLGDARDAPIEIRIDDRTRVAQRAPSGRMLADADDMAVQVHLTVLMHVSPRNVR
ncbi:hypothetical protein X892_2673 [Burkholderia pseudomallei MSHR3960]|nr:hypothetical protein X892_2673 [Burkholderia pseudomallei MSHR3960]